MRDLTHRFLALGLVALASACAATQPGTAPTGPSRAEGTDAAVIEDEIFIGVNARRGQNGLDDLSRQSDLDDLAREHSEAMAAGHVAFGHAGFGERLGTALARAGAKRGAENVSSQPRAASEVAPASIDRWLGSNEHRRNMLGDYGQTGIGVARAGDGRYFVTQIFVE